MSLTLPSLTGLIPLPYRILAIVLLIGACIGFGFVKGVSRESDRNSAQQLKTQQAEDKALHRALVSGKQHEQAVLEWQTAAETYYHDWQERLNHENDTYLAACVPEATGQKETPGAVPAVVLSAVWLGLYNGAWQPGLDAGHDPAGAAGQVVEAGVVTPRQVLDNVRINAGLCGEDRKRLDELIDTLNDAGKTR